MFQPDVFTGSQPCDSSRSTIVWFLVGVTRRRGKWAKVNRVRMLEPLLHLPTRDKPHTRTQTYTCTHSHTVGRPLKHLSNVVCLCQICTGGQIDRNVADGHFNEGADLFALFLSPGCCFCVQECLPMNFCFSLRVPAPTELHRKTKI